MAAEQSDAEPTTPTLSSEKNPKPSVLENPEDPWSYHNDTVPADVPVRLLPQLVQLVNSEDPKDQLQGALLVRKLLCVSENPSHNEVVVSQVVSRLISFMLRDDSADLQLESAWAVASIASGSSDHRDCLMDQGAASPLIGLLKSPSADIREHAAAALASMAGDSPTRRDDTLNLGVMAPLLQCVTTPTHNISVLRNGVSAVAKLCGSKPRPDLDTVCLALPVVVPLLAHADEEVVVNACSTLYHISDGPPDHIERVLNAGALPQVITLLTSDHASQQTAALRVIGNIAAGSDEQTQLLISSGALPSFHLLLQHPDYEIRKEVCWTLSNLCAGTPEQIQAVIDEDLFPPILKCIGAAESVVKKEAVWCVETLATGGTREQIRYVVEELNVFEHLVQVLTMHDSKIVKVALDAIQCLLDHGDDEKQRRGVDKNPYAEMVSEGEVACIESLQDHSDTDVYDAAQNIIDTFFASDDENHTASSAAASDTADAAGAGSGAPFHFAFE